MKIPSTLSVLAASCGVMAGLCLTACGPNRVAGGTSSEAEALLQGTVTKPDGSAAAGARVRIRPIGYLSRSGTDTSALADLVADSLGKVKWTTRDTGLFNLEAELGDTLGTLIRDISPGRESGHLTASLDTNGSIRVNLATPQAGSGYSLRVYGMERFQAADAQGIFHVTLPAGGYSLLIEHSPPSGSPLLVRDVQVASGKTTLLDSLRFPALDSVLLGYWAFEEGGGDSARDGSGNGHAGMVRGAQWVAGRKGLGLRFTQGQGYVDMGIPQPDTFAFGAARDYSFSVWAKTDNPVPNRGLGRRIISKQGGANGFSYFLRIFPDGRPGFASNTRKDTVKAPAGSVTAARDLIAPVNVGDGAWHHWAGVRKRNRLTLYIDGQAVASASDDSLRSDYSFIDYNDHSALLYPDPGQDNHLLIGCAKTGVDGFDGVIDEARVYGRALTPQEILLLADPF